MSKTAFVFLLLVIINNGVSGQISGLNAESDTIAAKLLNEVVVTGQFMEQSLKNSLYKVRVINKERIAMRAATDLIGVLNTELGVRFGTDYTLGETDIQLMGMSGQNVKILLDGVPLVDRGSARQSLSQIDINNIERIELVEGPMSVIYGTDALAGVINLITKKNYAKGKNTIQVAARVQEETVANNYDPLSGEGIHNESLGLSWQHKNGWNLGANLTRNDFGGWQGNALGREQEWKPKIQYLANGNIGYRTKGLDAWYRLDYLDEEIITKGKRESDDKAADTRYVTSRATHTAQADWRINEKWFLNSALSYQGYERRSRNTIMDLASGQEYLNPSATQDISVFNMFFFRSAAQYVFSDKLSFQPGVEIKSDQSSGQRIHGDPVISDYALFLSAEAKLLDKLNIRPGVRFSKNSVYDAPPVIPSLNIKYELGRDWALRASYAKGFRAPALRELYFTFHDASHDIEGNPNLKAEHSNSFNASLSWQNRKQDVVRFSSSVSGFYNVFENMISYATDPLNPSWSTLVNIDRYKTTGALFENSLIWKKLQATVGLSYTGRYNRLKGDSVADKAGNHLTTFLWSPEVNSNILYRFTKAGLSLGLSYKYTGSVPGYELATVNGEQVLRRTKLEGFQLADFTAAKTIGKLISLSAGVKNLFNITRLQNSSVNAGGDGHSASGPVLKSYGRSYFLGLQFNWQHNR
ncbi:MAG: TonB-dependent receptor [Chitinophagaceae bacterium]|nr:TonB-dependent receptor [Chitinophagaceae bacterium]